VEVTLIPSSSAVRSTFTPNEMARLRKVRHTFLVRHGITPRTQRRDR
jgi:hypothetical protein